MKKYASLIIYIIFFFEKLYYMLRYKVEKHAPIYSPFAANKLARGNSVNNSKHGIKHIYTVRIYKFWVVINHFFKEIMSVLITREPIERLHMY